MAGVRIPVEIKLGVLRQVAEGAKLSTSPLKQSLLSLQSAVYSPSFRSGRVVVSQSGSGQSGSFAMNLAGWTQENAFAVSEELIRVAEQCIERDGVADSGDPTETEALRRAMVFAYESGDIPTAGQREQMGDFSMLNFPASNTR